MSTTLLRRQLATARAARRESVRNCAQSVQHAEKIQNRATVAETVEHAQQIDRLGNVDNCQQVLPSSPQAAWQQILDAARYLPDGKVIIIGTMDAVLLHWWRQVSGRPNACPDGRKVPHKLYNRGVLRIEEFKRLEATYAKADKLDQELLTQVASQVICCLYLYELSMEVD